MIRVGRRSFKKLRTLLEALTVMAVFAVAGTSGNTAVRAHELKADNGISAVLHISPDDNPKSNQETLMYLAFKSENPAFNLGYCKCQISFQQSDNRLSTTSITPSKSDPLSGYATVTFDKPGAYKLNIRGSASDEPSDRFSFSYVVRVVAGTTEAEARARQSAGLQVILLGATALALIVIAASTMIRKIGRYARKPVASK